MCKRSVDILAVQTKLRTSKISADGSKFKGINVQKLCKNSVVHLMRFFNDSKKLFFMSTFYGKT